MKKRLRKKKPSAKFPTFIIALIFILAVFFTIIFVLLSKPQPKNIKQNIPQNIVQETDKYKDFSKYKVTYKFSINVTGNLKHLDFTFPIPQKENNKQYLSKLNINIKPTKVYKEDGNVFAKFVYDDIGKQNIDITLSGTAYLKTYNIKTAKLMKKDFIPEENLDRYLKSEKLIESDDPYIINIAKQIQGKNKEEILDNMYEYIQKNMTYKIVPQDLGAKKALQKGFGKCSEYSAIMVALCRAKQIPARIAAGNYARDYDTRHAWVEVYFDEYGWVTYDPTIQATEVKIYDAGGKLIKIQKEYNTSHEDVYYVKSGINIFSPYVMSFTRPGSSKGTASVKETFLIEKL